VILKRIGRFITGRGVSKLILVQFYHQLATLFNAGFGIQRALKVCAAHTSDGLFRDMVEEMYLVLESGAPLSTAFEHFPEVFTPFHVGMIKTAERSGNLPTILQNLATYEEKEMRLLSNLKSALAYPVFVTLTAFVIVILLTHYLCPLLNAVTTVLSPEKIPLITKILIVIGKCMSDIRFLAAMALLAIAAIPLYRKVSKIRKVRYVIDRLKLRLPSFGRLYKKVIIIRLCRVLSTLLSSGVPSVLSIRVVDEVAENVYFSDAIMKRIIWRVDEGRLFSEAFGESTFFPGVLINMFVIGEQTGKMPYVIDKIADLFEIDVTMFLANISSILEPLLILVLGTVTFFILLAAFLPLYSIMSNV
jgi:type IV pilus assembly protein PilC